MSSLLPLFVTQEDGTVKEVQFDCKTAVAYLIMMKKKGLKAVWKYMQYCLTEDTKMGYKTKEFHSCMIVLYHLDKMIWLAPQCQLF